MRTRVLKSAVAGLGVLACIAVPMATSSASAAPVSAGSQTPAVVLTPAGVELGLESQDFQISPDVQPASHTGSNGNTTIVVYGTGEEVDYWGTYADLGSVCGYAYFYVNGTEVAYSTKCYSGDPTTTIYYPDAPTSFPAGTKLCNEWAPGGTGYPCATIES